MLTTMPPPWEDEPHKGAGPDEGEGFSLTAPLNSVKASMNWTNQRSLLHEIIMIHYSMISFTRLSESSYDNDDVTDFVINLLSASLDNLFDYRDHMERR